MVMLEFYLPSEVMKKFFASILNTPDKMNSEALDLVTNVLPKTFLFHIFERTHHGPPHGNQCQLVKDICFESMDIFYRIDRKM